MALLCLCVVGLTDLSVMYNGQSLWFVSAWWPLRDDNSAHDHNEHHTVVDTEAKCCNTPVNSFRQLYEPACNMTPLMPCTLKWTSQPTMPHHHLMLLHLLCPPWSMMTTPDPMTAIVRLVLFSSWCGGHTQDDLPLQHRPMLVVHQRPPRYHSSRHKWSPVIHLLSFLGVLHLLASPSPMMHWKISSCLFIVA